MKTIKLKQLEITNFKNFKHKIINFNDTVTNIIGVNASGKTTIFDSFVWLLFDKDSQGRGSDLAEIRPLDENNEKIHRIDCIVSAVLDVNGEELTLKKEYKEKWVKKRGEENEEFQGNETLCYINGLKVKSTEYVAKINSLVDEKLFKLLTDPLYFNNLKWQEQRQIIIENIGAINDEDIYNENEDLRALKIINNSIEDTHKLATQTKNKLNTQKKEIPSKISEINLLIAKANEELQQLDDTQKTQLEQRLIEIENAHQELNSREETYINQAKGIEKSDQARNEKVKEIEQYKHSIISKNMQFNYSITQKKNEHFQLERELNAKKVELQDLTNTINVERKNVVDLREKETEIANQCVSFDNINDKCMTCGNPLTDTQVEMIKEKHLKVFNDKKDREQKVVAQEIEKTIEKGKQLKNRIVETETRIKELETKLQAFTIESLTPLPIDETAYINDETYLSMMNNLPKLQKMNEFNEKILTDIRIERISLNNEKDSIHTQLKQFTKIELLEQTIKTYNDRVNELMQEQQAVSQEINSQDRIIFLCEQFNKVKNAIINERIKNIFNGLYFKLYAQQVNGGEKETCELVENGVPYRALNNALKINVGLKMIKALSTINQVVAPIFIDNRESVTTIEKVDTQIINLIVPPMKMEADVKL